MSQYPGAPLTDLKSLNYSSNLFFHNTDSFKNENTTTAFSVLSVTVR